MHRFARVLPFVSLLLLLVIGCGSGTNSVTIPSPSVTQFTSTPQTVTAGQSVSLTWVTANATSVSIDQGAVALNGSLTETPAQTTTYTLTATGAGGTATASTTVTVTPVVTPLPTIAFSATPASIVSGQGSTLNWSTTNATSVSIDNAVGTVALTGTTSVSPTQTTTYTLTATGAGGTATATALVTVTLPAVPTATFTATPTTIQSGATSTLSWTTSGATTVSIDNGVGTVAATGTLDVMPTQTTTYTLTATNAGGSTTATAMITVTTLAPGVTIIASQTTVAPGGSSTLTWTTSNAVTASIDNGVGTVALNGSVSVSPTATTTYTITATGGGQSATASATIAVEPVTQYSGVLGWKGGSKGIGRYDRETQLTTANVNPAKFGKTKQMFTNGVVLPQPLYVRDVDMGTAGVHDLIIVANEGDNLYAYDGKGTSTTALWRTNYISGAVTTQSDDHGGRSQFGGQIGITGTPVVDATSGTLYVVVATQTTSGGVATVIDTVHAIDIKTGLDKVGSGTVITYDYPGTGEGSVNGKITFAPAQQNQRTGLILSNGVLYIPFGSFSDWPPYHGWLFAYDPTTLQQLGVFNSSPTYRADYDHGSGAAFWNGGAAPSLEEDGTFYVVAADGSTDVENGGVDYGDSVLHMKFANGAFSVIDWFTPFNRDCIDFADLEMGSGGFALLPDEVGNGKHVGVVLTKEGRLYLLDRNSLGNFDATADKSLQMFMVGQHQCDSSSTEQDADGPIWNRLYGNASYWNGNLYMAASNLPVTQYSIGAGAINSTPVATAATNTGVRGANTIVSADGTSNGIVWAYEKTADGNALLHAYDATDVSKELWNSNMNAGRDGLVTGGQGFGTPIVIDGKVIVASGQYVDVYSLLP